MSTRWHPSSNYGAADTDADYADEEVINREEPSLVSIMAGQLTDAEGAERFMMAGNATITLRSVATGKRFTYKVRKPDDFKEHQPIWFVSLLTGDNNENSFNYIGQLKRARGTYHYEHGKKTRISAAAPSVAAFVFWSRHLFERNQLHVAVEVWHEGRCGRCNRKLTVPESVASGFGPECINYVGGAALATLERNPK